MGYKVGNEPGGWVRGQSARRERWIWVFISLFVVVALVTLAFAVGHALSVAGSLLLIATMLIARPYVESYLDDHLRLDGGMRAEVAVGNTLNELIREEWTVMHDVVHGHGGNIDHIARGPGGVFLIETKACRYEDSDLGTTKWRAKRLHDELDVWVEPVICLHHRSGAPFKHKGVWVVPHQHLLDWLRSQRNAVLPFERLARFADSL